ncbi:MAG: hypothetical protein AAF791_07860 [Bacteroidota bacterium]
MPRFLRPFGAVAFAAVVLAACAAPPPADMPVLDTTPTVTTEPAVADNGICEARMFFLSDNVRQNYSLAAEFYRNATGATEENLRVRTDAFCSAYPYLMWLLDNEPLYTGGEPDDRNFLRLANIYEFYATQDSLKRKVYLDSALTTRTMGVEALTAANISYDEYARDLREGYFYYSYSDVYDDASQRQFDAFNSAFEAKPDSLDDWYLSRLVELGAELYEDPMERADYMESLVPAFDNATTARYVAGLVEYARTPPADPAQAATPDLVASLITKFDADPQSLDDTERRQLFAASNQLPDLVEENGGNPEAIQDAYFDDIVGALLEQNPDALSASQFYALFRRSWRRDNREQAEEYFNQAIAKAETNAQRADFYYARAAGGLGSRSSLLQQALSYQPQHGPSLYAQAQAYASGVGRPSSPEGRAAFWCLADRFNRVAASGDPRVASRARRAAAGYNRAGPAREDYFFKGWSPGQSIRASSGSVSCTTRVR